MPPETSELVPRIVTEAQLQEMERLYAEGYGTSTLSEQYGVSVGSVWRWLRARGVKMRSPSAKPPGKICRHPDGYLIVSGKFEHRRVMEEKLGRPLRKGEVVHHINGVPDDNRPENLELAASNGEHQAYFHGARVWTAQISLRLVALWMRGWSQSEIAKMLGCPLPSLRGQIQELQKSRVLPTRQPNRRKIACKHGHPWTAENRLIYGTKSRCRICQLLRSRKWRKAYHHPEAEDV